MAPVPLTLGDNRVDPRFREALIDASDREGVSINEFCLLAAAEKMARRGFEFSGVWRKGDLVARGLVRTAA